MRHTPENVKMLNDLDFFENDPKNDAGWFTHKKLGWVFHIDHVSGFKELISRIAKSFYAEGYVDGKSSGIKPRYKYKGIV